MKTIVLYARDGVGKKLLSWDITEVIENEVRRRLEEWQEFYPERTEPPTEEAVQNDVWNDPYHIDVAFEDEAGYLTEILQKKNPEGYWRAEVLGFGWRGLSGNAYFHATDGKDFLREILPKTDCTFRIFNYGRGLALQNFHHDSPVGKEWYYILPISSKKYSEVTS